MPFVSTGDQSPLASPKLDSIEKPPVLPELGSDTSRGNPSHTVQSPILGSTFQNQHQGSMIRDEDGTNDVTTQHQQTQDNHAHKNSVEPRVAEVAEHESSKSVPIYYDASQGGFQAGTVEDERVRHSDSQKSNRSQKFASSVPRSGSTPNKLSKSQSMRNKDVDHVADRGSRLSARASLREALVPEPSASIENVTGAFAMGAAMSAPDADLHNELGEGFRERAVAAEGSLTRKQSSKIRKHEQTFSRRIAKIIQGEAKTEHRALEAAIKELAELQKLQQAAVKEESRTHTLHTKALQNLHAREVGLIKAQSDMENAQAEIDARLAKIQIELNKLKGKVRAQYEKAQAEVERTRAEVKAQDEQLEASKKHALDITEMVKGKRKEVEVLRGWMSVDDREREAKLNELTG